RQGRTALRAALLHAQAGHPPRHRQGVGSEDSGAEEAVAAGRGRWGRIRSGEWLHPHLGVREHGPADEDSRRGEAEGRLAAAGWRRSSAHAGEQDPAAGIVLTAPVVFEGQQVSAVLHSLRGAGVIARAPVYRDGDIDARDQHCLNGAGWAFTTRSRRRSRTSSRPNCTRSAGTFVCSISGSSASTRRSPAWTCVSAPKLTASTAG